MLALDQKTHTYTNDGRVIPHSVSSVLADAGLIDGRFFTEEGRVNGTRRHLVCQLDAENDLVESSVDPVDQPYLKARRAFNVCTGWVSVYIEQPIYSSRLDVAGCPDDVGYFPGDHSYTILDWKTGSEGAARAQTAGYVQIYNDHHSDKHGYMNERIAVGRCALLLRPDGTFRYQKYPVADLRRDIDKFLWAVSEAKKKETNKCPAQA